MIVDTLITPLLSRLADRLSSNDLRLVELTYERAADRHEGQRRYNGDPYITYPVEVASLVTAAVADPATICAALLHDIDEPGFNLDCLGTEFGAEITGLVADVTTMDREARCPRTTVSYSSNSSTACTTCGQLSAWSRML